MIQIGKLGTETLKKRNGNIVRRAWTGELLTEIGSDYGISRERVRQIARAAGVPTTAELRGMRLEDALVYASEHPAVSMAELSERFLLNPARVSRHLKENGVLTSYMDGGPCADCGKPCSAQRKRCSDCGPAHTRSRMNWKYHNDPAFRRRHHEAQQRYRAKRAAEDPDYLENRREYYREYRKRRTTEVTT